MSLGGTDVQDEDLKYLTGLKSLEELSLSNTAITDQGLEPLLDIPSLKRLYVAGTEATPEGVAEWEERYEDRHGSHCWVRGKEVRP